MHMIDIHTDLQKFLQDLAPLRYVILYRKSNQYIIYKQADANVYVAGLFEIIIQGETFLTAFSFIPSQSPVCTATRVNPGLPPKFGVEVVNVSLTGQSVTAQIQVFPR